MGFDMALDIGKSYAITLTTAKDMPDTLVFNGITVPMKGVRAINPGIQSDGKRYRYMVQTKTNCGEVKVYYGEWKDEQGK